MTFNFSIRTALKQSWQLYTKHPVFWSSLAFVFIIFNLFSKTHSHNIALLLIVSIATLLWTYVWISVALAAVDGKEGTLNYKSLSQHMPSGRQFFMLLWISIVVGLIIALSFMIPLIPGFIVAFGVLLSPSVTLWPAVLTVFMFLVLLIPGIYIATRLAFVMAAYVDRQGGLKSSLRYSWNLVKGKIFWTVLLVMLVQGIMVVVGAFLLMVGLLVAYPLTVLMFTQLYRSLGAHHRAIHS